MHALADKIETMETRRFRGKVSAVNGVLVEAVGPINSLLMGARAQVETKNNAIRCEVIGFQHDRALLMPFAPLEGVHAGAKIQIDPEVAHIRPSQNWLGRVVNAFGEPLDDKGALAQGMKPCSLRGAPPQAHARDRVGSRIDLGVRALNVFVQVCRGQRLGVFAGSGVGKSVLMSMLAKNADCDVIIIGLIGERGREVKEFIDDVLGEDGLKRAIVVVATSDEPALARRQAALLTMTLAEYFRDQGNHVLCLMDSITRFAMAQREIGLAAGEPPTTRGYTPSVFNELPRLLERAGPGCSKNGKGGAITGIFTVLVDGDDHNEPIADAARGILDGHIVMERAIAERGRFPAINILKSVSRTMPGCAKADELQLISTARKAMAEYADMEELIRLGAYAKGSNPDVDLAIELHEPLEAFLAQTADDASSTEDSFLRLGALLPPPTTTNNNNKPANG
ncbi:Flagellum-specific ATP synthase FliI [hydrothermal vent metagenome]|uniref:Flagellum-specific ATP synthase n=1 Tax=hydrothermal vent metagenome TaxID=652676 RepID=A0A3B0RL56_9ZZZZ